MKDQAISRETSLNMALGEIARNLLMEDWVEDTSPIVLDKAMELTESEVGVIGHVDSETGNFINLFSNSCTSAGQGGKISESPEKNGLWKWMRDNRTPLLSNTGLDSQGCRQEQLGTVSIHRLIAVPILDGEKLIGLIATANAATDYEGSDLQALEQIADLYARARRHHQENKNLRLFRGLVDQSNDAIYVIDPLTSQFLIVNEAAHRLLGYERDEFLSRRVIDISATDSDLATWHRGIEYLRTVPYHVFEGEQIRKDGTLLPVEVNARLIRQDGKEYMISVARDIRDRKRAANAVVEERNKLEAVLAALGDGLTMQDRQFRILYQNEAHKKRRGDCKGEFCYRAYHGREQICDGCLLALCFADGQVHRREVSSVSADGKASSWLISASPVRDAHGVIYTGIETIHDITEQKRVERVLRESESRYRLLFESAGDAITISLGTTFMECNQKALELFGCDDRSQVVRKPILKFSAETQLDGRPASELIPEKIDAALKGERQCFPWKHMRRDGTVVETEVTLNRIDLGKGGNVLAIIRDVTAQKQHELQLHQAQKMESIGTLAGGIAHDFNNILSAIVGYTDLAMLRGEKGQGRLQDDLQQIRAAAARATDLVRQILTFSRKQYKEKTPLQIASVVKEALKLLRASIPTTIEIRQEILSQGTVLANPTEIHQLIMNLGTNAFHAMEGGGGVLGISLKEVNSDHKMLDSGTELPPGRYVALSVSDTGCGMDQETMSQIFEPYFTTKELGRGTGLGLAVVHGIVKGHSGKIAAYSEPGRGTTFNVYLPMIAQEAAEAAVEETPSASTAHELVMVVDDESAIRDLAGQFLVQAGYRVETFANGIEAWQTFSQRPNDFDILITDQTMPTMTGEQLAAKVLAIRPGLPIILCSGFSSKMGDDQFTQGGITTFLQKPVSMNLLLRQVAKALAEKR